jgi:agmatinase
MVLPVPYEATTCYMPGTSEGPEAIIRASTQIETFDEELQTEYTARGIVTLEAIHPVDDSQKMMIRIYDTAAAVIESGGILISLGGEHSITPPIVDACKSVHKNLSVLQIDAHADLRQSYNGTEYSHACVMRRVLDITPDICQVGIRSYSEEEFKSFRDLVKRFITPQEVARDVAWVEKVLGMLNDDVYVTIDMDGLDPSIAPGVGTPEPGGLTWQQVTRLLRSVCAVKNVVGADIVEVRPLPSNPLTEFTAARLACKIIAYTQRA